MLEQETHQPPRYLNLVLITGTNWLAIAVAFSPEEIGTTAGSNATTVVGAAGIKRISYDQLETEYFEPSTTRRTTTESSTDIPSHLNWLYLQARHFLDVLVRAGETLQLPGGLSYPRQHLLRIRGITR